MPMSIPFDTSRPIYMQLAERITRKIIAGEYAAGERLPSVRDLAAEFGVNPNTLQRAFAELERQGLLYTERTAGRFVTQNTATICAVRDALAQQMLDSFTQQMAQMGYTTAQIVALLHHAQLPEQSTPPADLQAEPPAPLQADQTNKGEQTDE